MQLTTAIEMLDEFTMRTLYENVATSVNSCYSRVLDAEEKSCDSSTSDHSDAYEHAESNPECKNGQSCQYHQQRIDALERQLQLVKQQYASLIVNSCTLYNTLASHISKLEARLKEVGMATSAQSS